MTQTFDIMNTIWCAGCGHFGVKNALAAALKRLAVPAHETMVLAGIGCSGTIQNNVDAYGYHALHGRVLPAAIGVHLANPDLTVIAAGGDGYAIGAGHLVHTFKRNPGFVYLLMNNGVYGLTKGQHSPTAAPSDAGAEAGLDGIALGLALPGSTFLARGFSGAPQQLERLTLAALEHSRAGRGFAFLEILSPCVTYNDTYADWTARVVDLDAEAGYDRTDRVTAFARISAAAAADRIATGLIYEGTAPAMARPADQQTAAASRLEADRDLMAQYAV